MVTDVLCIGPHLQTAVQDIYKLLNQLFALVSFCSKKLLHFLKLFFTLIKILKLQHVSVLMGHPQGVRRT